MHVLVAFIYSTIMVVFAFVLFKFAPRSLFVTSIIPAFVFLDFHWLHLLRFDASEPLYPLYVDEANHSLLIFVLLLITGLVVKVSKSSGIENDANTEFEIND